MPWNFYPLTFQGHLQRLYSRLQRSQIFFCKMSWHFKKTCFDAAIRSPLPIFECYKSHSYLPCDLSRSTKVWTVPQLLIIVVFSFLPLGHTWLMEYCHTLRCLSVCLSVCLSIQFLLAYIHDWHQTITAYLPCPVLVPHTITLALRPLTLAWWPLPWLCLLPQNCLNETSHQCQNGIFAAFCQYLRWVRRAVNLVDIWPTF